jgi:hypothetical protein
MLISENLSGKVKNRFPIAEVGGADQTIFPAAFIKDILWKTQSCRA